MTDKVIKLTSVPKSPNTPDGVLQATKQFLIENELLVEWDETDVGLEAANADEALLGNLTVFERDNYVIGQLLQQVVHETLIEIEAGGTDQLGVIMREQRVNAIEAARILEQNSTEYLELEDKEYLNKAALTLGYCMTQYEHSVRRRFNVWTGQLIVRSGFVAYVFNRG